MLFDRPICDIFLKKGCIFKSINIESGYTRKPYRTFGKPQSPKAGLGV